MPEADRPDRVLDLIRSVEPPPHDSQIIWQRVQSRRAEWVDTSPRPGVKKWPAKIAAGLVLALLGLSATVEPLRSAANAAFQPVQNWTHAAVEKILRTADPPLPAAVLIPANPLIRVQVDHCQQAGVIRIVRSDGRSAALSIASPEGGEYIVPLSGGARVRNSRTSTASYRLIVPSGVRHVALRLGRALVLVPVMSTGAAAWDIYLNSPAGDQIGHCNE